MSSKKYPEQMAWSLAMLTGMSFLAAAASVAEDGLLSQNEESLFDVLLIPEDVTMASDLLKRFDDDEDGSLSQSEMKRLPWAEEAEHYDLNRDGKLTHLELCVWHAAKRAELGIVTRNLNGARQFLGRYDIDRNGWLDPSEIAAGGWPKNPEEMDLNGDGNLTLIEIAAHFAHMSQLRAASGIEPFDQVRAMQYLRAHDENGDGKLDINEAQSAVLPRPRELHDLDKDGLLSVSELTDMYARERKEKGIDPADQSRALEMMRSIDMNADGVIDAQEMTLDRQGRFRAYDTNGDGIVTLEEIVKKLRASREDFGISAKDEAAAQRLILRQDINRNGTIEKSELYPDKDKAPGRLTESQMSGIDLDQDGVLSVSEIAAYLAQQESVD